MIKAWTTADGKETFYEVDGSGLDLMNEMTAILQAIVESAKESEEKNEAISYLMRYALVKSGFLRQVAEWAGDEWDEDLDETPFDRLIKKAMEEIE